MKSLDYLLLKADALMIPLADKSVHCCVTSPPYWGLRDYGVAGQLGLEPTPDEYVANMVKVFREVRRVLRDDGTCWVNLGDSYVFANNTNNGGNANFGTQPGRTFDMSAKASWTGLRSKNLIGIPWRVAFALQADGWYLRSDIIWSKPNPMPESVTDRPTKAHEYIFLLSKSERYYFDSESVRLPPSGITGGACFGGPDKEAKAQAKIGTAKRTQQRAATKEDRERYAAAGANIRTVWHIPTQPYVEAHFATYPEALIEPCIKAGCPVGGIVFDPFNGSGTTGAVAIKHGRRYVGIDISSEYLGMAVDRIGKAARPGTHRSTRQTQDAPLFATEAL